MAEAMTEQEFWQAVEGLLEMGLLQLVQEDGEEEPRICLTPAGEQAAQDDGVGLGVLWPTSERTGAQG